MIFTIIIIITIIILSIIIIITISRNFCYLQTSLFSTNAILNHNGVKLRGLMPRKVESLKKFDPCFVSWYVYFDEQ